MDDFIYLRYEFYTQFIYESKEVEKAFEKCFEEVNEDDFAEKVWDFINCANYKFIGYSDIVDALTSDEGIDTRVGEFHGMYFGLIMDDSGQPLDEIYISSGEEYVIEQLKSYINYKNEDPILMSFEEYKEKLERKFEEESGMEVELEFWTSGKKPHSVNVNIDSFSVQMAFEDFHGDEFHVLRYYKFFKAIAEFIEANNMKDSEAEKILFSMFLNKRKDEVEIGSFDGEIFDFNLLTSKDRVFNTDKNIEKSIELLKKMKMKMINNPEIYFEQMYF